MGIPWRRRIPWRGKRIPWRRRIPRRGDSLEEEDPLEGEEDPLEEEDPLTWGFLGGGGSVADNEPPTRSGGGPLAELPAQENGLALASDAMVVPNA